MVQHDSKDEDDTQNIKSVDEIKVSDDKKSEQDGNESDTKEESAQLCQSDDNISYNEKESQSAISDSQEEESPRIRRSRRRV